MFYLPPVACISALTFKPPPSIPSKPKIQYALTFAKLIRDREKVNSNGKAANPGYVVKNTLKHGECKSVRRIFGVIPSDERRAAVSEWRAARGGFRVASGERRLLGFDG
jgi:hypothetical protein